MTTSPQTIPDLHYIVVPLRPHFARAGHLTVFYRHDRNGKPYIYHNMSHYGHDGRKTRAAAARYGREVCTRTRSMGYRNTCILHGAIAAVIAKGLDPSYTG